MPVERARRIYHERPWGVSDLRPLGPETGPDHKTGEVWFEREDHSLPEPSLCLKLLFASQPLSIQVHPDDDYAHTLGLPFGKTEAWYVVNATPGAQVGLGLTQSTTKKQFRASAADGSVADLLLWRGVLAGDSCVVPAGTVHAIGAGVVVAEIQQRADVTFRLFDHHRGRELHLEHAIAVADVRPAGGLFQQCRLSDTRRLVAVSPYFVFELLDLPPETNWRLEADCETWLLALDGGATAGNLALNVGEAIFSDSDEVKLRVGPGGLVALVAYAKSGPLPFLLRRLALSGEDEAEDGQRDQVMATFTCAMTFYARTPQETQP
jgi:mannose-6-phosphate isomerase